MSDLYDNLAIAALAGELGAEELAEWHGTVTGVICAAPSAELADRLVPLAAPGAARDEPAPTDDATESAPPIGPETAKAVFPTTVEDADAATVIERTRAALDEDALAFEPLLIGDAPLTERALALGAWCQGFLYGLATTQPDFAALLDADGREVVEDFGAIALAVRGGEDVEEAENAYAELFEFVRVGVQLICEHLREARRRSDAAPSPPGHGNGHDQSA